jgi:Family of unknown function (DUF5906)
MTAATFDLRTGIGRPPSPKDMITKKGGCTCAPAGTPHPLWSAFLERVAPDPELRTFLKRWCGYSMTGATTEHKFCFAYGTGANGKSTFINTIMGILGDYATVADVGTFIASNTERHPTDVAKLHGFRLVVAQETEKGRRWDEAKIKSMTGGDKMTARFMRCDFFDFTPKFKLWITGNHKPRLDNVDEAMGACCSSPSSCKSRPRNVIPSCQPSSSARMARNPALDDRRLPRTRPEARQREVLIRCPARPRLDQEEGHRRRPRVPQSRAQNGMTIERVADSGASSYYSRTETDRPLYVDNRNTCHYVPLSRSPAVASASQARCKCRCKCAALPFIAADFSSSSAHMT